MGAGCGPIPVGGSAEPPGDRPRGVCNELIGPQGALAQVVCVPVGADGVAAAGAAVVLIGAVAGRDAGMSPPLVFTA